MHYSGAERGNKSLAIKVHFVASRCAKQESSFLENLISPSPRAGHLRYFFIFSMIKMIFLYFLSS